MRTYTVTEFRDNLAAVLDRAAEELVVIQRNGREYEVRLRKPAARARQRSGLDVAGVVPKAAATLDGLLDDLAATRERG